MIDSQTTVRIYKIEPLQDQRYRAAVVKIEPHLENRVASRFREKQQNRCNTGIEPKQAMRPDHCTPVRILWCMTASVLILLHNSSPDAHDSHRLRAIASLEPQIRVFRGGKLIRQQNTKRYTMHTHKTQGVYMCMYIYLCIYISVCFCVERFCGFARRAEASGSRLSGLRFTRKVLEASA